MKSYLFLDGSIVQVEEDTCRGCYLEKTVLSDLLVPIWQNRDFVIRQDAECPVPGFYIISTRKHIHSFGDFSKEMASDIGLIIHRTRKHMEEDLGICRAHVFLEEKLIEPHFHIWLLPLWREVMDEKEIDPKIWNANIREYIELFTFQNFANKIRECNAQMRAMMESDPYLLELRERGG